MNKTSILAGAALIALSGAAFAQQGPARGERNADVTRQQVIERTDQRFGRLDGNNDGRVTPEEARQAHEQRRAERAGRAFERLDLNRDGSITRAEFDQAREQIRGQRAERRAQRGPRPGMRGMRGMRGQRLFGEQGFVTREQFRERALARFDRLDANDDGTVTVAERQQLRQQRRERIQQRRSQPD